MKYLETEGVIHVAHSDPQPCVALFCHFADESQKSEGACARLQSQETVGLGFKPRVSCLPSRNASSRCSNLSFT